jgi:protein ImuB
LRWWRSTVRALRVMALSAPAAALGLENGITLADARLRFDLAALPHDPAADALLARLGKLALDFSPQVSRTRPPRWCWTSPAARICSAARRDGARAGGTAARPWHHRPPALAATPAAALALARWGAMEALPLAALAADELGDADAGGAAPRRDAARGRCGAPAARGAGQPLWRALVRRLARLLGEEEAPFQPISPPDPIHARRRFAEPVGRDADVLAAVGALVEETGARWHGGLGGRRFALALERSDGHVARLAIDTAAHPRPALVLRLLRERIDSLADPLDPGFGYDAIALGVPLAEPLDEALGPVGRRRAPPRRWPNCWTGWPCATARSGWCIWRRPTAMCPNAPPR